MELGKLSAAYESNGDPAIVSTGEGDRGGLSYGAYQLASNCGAWMRSSVGACAKKMDSTKTMQGLFKVQALSIPMNSLTNGKN